MNPPHPSPPPSPPSVPAVVSPPDMAADAPEHRPGPTLGGRWVVLLTLSLFLLVPALVVAIHLAITAGDQAAPEAPLVWSQRETWPRNQFTVFKSLERGQMSSARTNRVHYEKLGLQISPEHYLAVQQAAELARRPAEAFDADDTRVALEDLIDQTPGQFYPHYLLGIWHQRHGQTREADAAFERAFGLAPAALIRHHVDARGGTAAYRPAPEIRLIVDRVVDDHRDPSLVLVYPHLRTDDQGFVYLPVFKAILRHADAAPLPGMTDQTQKPLWFSFFGQVGRLPDQPLPR